MLVQFGKLNEQWCLNFGDFFDWWLVIIEWNVCGQFGIGYCNGIDDIVIVVKVDCFDFVGVIFMSEQKFKIGKEIV